MLTNLFELVDTDWFREIRVSLAQVASFSILIPAYAQEN